MLQINTMLRLEKELLASFVGLLVLFGFFFLTFLLAKRKRQAMILIYSSYAAEQKD